MQSILGKNVNDVMDDSVLGCTELKLCQQGLTDIAGIDIFTELRVLYLHNNQLTNLPESISNLINLRELIYVVRR